jgi:ABC-type branched-subunit amino acid transport system ATPase component
MIAPTAVDGAPVDGAGEYGLVVESLSVHFGGLVALDNVTLQAPRGRLTGLIGPNGAGKTTLFNACSGLIRPTSGRILLFEREITHAGPPRRAQLGLGRTFQKLELCNSLTVAENVSIGLEARLAASRPWSHVSATPSDREQIEQHTEEALERCGLGVLRNHRAGTLATGQRRLVELARVLAGGFEMLLLDEPSSGLDSRETEEFARVVRTAVAECGIGAIVVEHDVALVMALCEHIYVLDFGKLIFDGDPTRVAASATVRAAYLGAEVA